MSRRSAEGAKADRLLSELRLDKPSLMIGEADWH
jgi:hypothetical protein